MELKPLTLDRLLVLCLTDWASQGGFYDTFYHDCFKALEFK